MQILSTQSQSHTAEATHSADKRSANIILLKLKVASVSKQRWKKYLTRLPNAWNPRHLERDIWMFKNQHDDIQSPSKHAATARRLVA